MRMLRCGNHFAIILANLVVPRLLFMFVFKREMAGSITIRSLSITHETANVSAEGLTRSTVLRHNMRMKTNRDR